MLRPRLLRAALPLSAYLALAVGLFANAWRAPFATIVGYPGDAFQSIWFLRWPGFALTHGLNPLLSTYVNHPHGANLMWNTAIFVPAMLLWPVTAAFGPVDIRATTGEGAPS